MNVLQLQNQMQCLHDYCLQRSLDPSVDYAMIEVQSSVGGGHNVKINDHSGRVLVTVGISVTMHEDDWLPCITQVLGAIDLETQVQNDDGRSHALVFTYKSGMREDDQINYTQTMQTFY